MGPNAQLSRPIIILSFIKNSTDSAERTGLIIALPSGNVFPNFFFHISVVFMFHCRKKKAGRADSLPFSTGSYSGLSCFHKYMKKNLK